jgi:hypothetical protein
MRTSESGHSRSSRHSVSGRREPPFRFDVSGRGGQAEFRHVDVDAFAFSRLDEIGLVPDADCPIVANSAIESGPSRKMVTRAIVCLGDELVEAFPILLNENDAA